MATTTKTPATSNAVLAEHADAIRALRSRIVSDVVEIGRRLAEVKLIVGHGNWLPWLDREFGWSEDTAERFIRVHEFVDGLSDSATVRNLVLTLPVSSVYLLAAPSTPQQARDEIIERAGAAEKLPVAEVKRTVEKHKGRKQSSSKPRKAGKKSDHRVAAPSAKPQAEKHRDDIGPASAGEVARKDAEIEDLHNAKRRLEIENDGLRREIEELRAKLAATGIGGAMSFPEFQTAIKKYEETVETQRGIIADRDRIIARLENENATLRAGVAAPPDDDLDIPPCSRRAAP